MHRKVTENKEGLCGIQLKYIQHRFYSTEAEMTSCILGFDCSLKGRVWFYAIAWP